MILRYIFLKINIALNPLTVVKLEPPKINPKKKLDFDPNNPWHVEAVARAPEFHNKLIEEHVTELFMNKTVGFQVCLAYFFLLLLNMQFKCTFENGLCDGWTGIAPGMTWIKHKTDSMKMSFDWEVKSGPG